MSSTSTCTETAVPFYSPSIYLCIRTQTQTMVLIQTSLFSVFVVCHLKWEWQDGEKLWCFLCYCCQTFRGGIRLAKLKEESSKVWLHFSLLPAVETLFPLCASFSIFLVLVKVIYPSFARLTCQSLIFLDVSMFGWAHEQCLCLYGPDEGKRVDRFCEHQTTISPHWTR